uniref:Ig-like domain-containing protein n=1 Tax=Oreochromis aureus TaxID=47969 RepID=A0A668SR78_OREAU
MIITIMFLKFNSLLLCVLFSCATVTHSLQYFYTASSGIPHFPEFVTVGVLDGQPFTYYDSKIKKESPKQDWMAKSEGAEYWDRQTRASIADEQIFKGNIEFVKQRLNETGGVHVYQEMYGCEWDTETNNVTGYDQLGYDGEDFLAFDLKTETWIAPKQQAVIAKQKCDSDRALSARQKNYFTHICPEWLKKYLNYSGSSLRGTVLPSVSLLQKSSSSPITCHATGFYPHKAKLFWRKDGKQLHEGVNRGEILPNNDGTLQISADLALSSVKPEDWRSYDCVFQLCGVNKDIITRLDRAVIRTNEGNSLFMIIPMILALGVLAVITVIGFIIYKKKTGERTKQIL